MTDTWPKWERGYRCHGFWLGQVQVGRVGIGPKHLWTPADGYSWVVWKQGCVTCVTEAEGTLPTLAEAKRRVELVFRLRWTPPAGLPPCQMCKQAAWRLHPVYLRERWGNALRGDGDSGFSGAESLICDRCRDGQAGAYSLTPYGSRR